MAHFPLVSVQWLKGAVHDPDVVVLDSTYHLPIFNRDPWSEFLEKRIPKARFFDLDGIKDVTNPLPHMVPSPEVFAEAVGALGITNKTHVVCYDTYGMFSAARPWWMFRLYGHEKVSILDGGLPAWEMAGYETVGGSVETPATTEFTAGFRPELLWQKTDVLDNIDTKKRVMVDVRPLDRFDGSAPEPRPETRSGHMPDALNIPFTKLSDTETKKMISVYGIESLVRKAGIKLGRDKVVTSCGSGVTACLLAFGMHLLGDETVAVYDGSWSEWGTDPTLPVINPSAE